MVVGLLIGVLAGSTLLGGGGDAGSGPEESMALDQPLIWQLQGAGALAQAAATGDESYQAFGEQGMELFRAMSTLDLELAQSTLTAMESSCADF